MIGDSGLGIRQSRARADEFRVYHLLATGDQTLGIRKREGIRPCESPIPTPDSQPLEPNGMTAPNIDW
ncbi:hypothetical protein XAP412_790013 [Xanthomonas phaseoli pv. phaseoli]|uniref:Transposase n=1 Tax=Xanthomonas campestris pv. phaseoli TaxID=317013 RepID=A0AB38E5Y8_XANCH|nr:hypothetical protein XAP6984_830013 [Xanthomonas phaseoli pv. phaseoli]SON90583.1 hypothetical protein XAP412_790013 [Xanthomonas phaseoli pv. phaseoli]SON92530.1 hypothetical protein XAP7430_790013 [Xanthomonas phaseoli pv. phaseoli]SOO06721.1 hypothetical protein XFF7767_80131 [Xanthomonas citri pv. fuscans]SOO29436.1 hypothetical protein XAP6164_3320040 [Xanthomonas phaseoli pv. phaseoli]